MTASSPVCRKTLGSTSSRIKNQMMTLVPQRNEEDALNCAASAPFGTAVSGFAARSWYRIRSRHYATRPLVVCRGEMGELRQILWIRDICRGIRLSAFEALPRIRLGAWTCHVTVCRPTSSKQMTRDTKYAPGRGLAKFVRQRRGKRNACCSRAGALVGGIAVRERDRRTRFARGLKREYHVRPRHGKEQVPGPVHKLAVRAENPSDRIFKAPGIRRMHLSAPDGVGLGRDLISGLNVILQYGAELILLFFSRGPLYAGAGNW
jgi:hypothetical protein